MRRDLDYSDKGRTDGCIANVRCASRCCTVYVERLVSWRLAVLRRGSGNKTEPVSLGKSGKARAGQCHQGYEPSSQQCLSPNTHSSSHTSPRCQYQHQQKTNPTGPPRVIHVMCISREVFLWLILQVIFSVPQWIDQITILLNPSCLQLPELTL